MNIALHRLVNQQIARHPLKKVGQLVAWLGAIQAQDYPGAKWALALRIPGTTESEIDQAIATKTIIRTWPMRGGRSLDAGIAHAPYNRWQRQATK